jgi:hypothetical protein
MIDTDICHKTRTDDWWQIKLWNFHTFPTTASSNLETEVVYKLLGIMCAKLWTSLTRSSPVGNFPPRSGYFIFFNEAHANRAKSREYGQCGKMLCPRDANFLCRLFTAVWSHIVTEHQNLICPFSLAPMQDSVMKICKGVAVQLVVYSRKSHLINTMPSVPQDNKAICLSPESAVWNFFGQGLSRFLLLYRAFWWY